MAIVGSAYVEIHTTTNRVASEIRRAFRDGMRGIGKQSGDQFAREFASSTRSSITSGVKRISSQLSPSFGQAGQDSGQRFRDRFLTTARGIKPQLEKTRIVFKTDLDAQGVTAKVNALAARLRRTITFNVNVNAAQAQAQVAVQSRAMKRNIPWQITINKGSILKALATVSLLENALRLIIVPAGIVAAIPYVLSLGASFVQAAGAAYLIPAAFGAIALAAGTLVIGFSGVGSALQELVKQDTSSAASASTHARQRIAASRAIRSAQESLANAVRQADRTAIQGAQAVAEARQRLADIEQSVATRIVDAQESVARAYETAARRMESAEESLASAQRAAARDQEAINRARETARERIEDLSLSLRDAALDEEEAQYRLREAQREFARASAQGLSGDQLLEYDLAVRRAQLSLDRAKESHEDLKIESAEAARTGVEGSAEVVEAQERAAESLQQVRDAEQEVARTRVENARDIADAEKDLMQSRIDGARDIADAQSAVSQAIVQANESNEDAARAVAEAYRSLGEAVTDAADTSTAATDRVAAAMARLSPAARQLVTTIWGLRPAWDAVRLDVQERLLTGVASRFNDLARNYIPILHGALGTVADGFNVALKSSIDFFNTAQTSADMKIGLDNTALGISNASKALQPLLQMFRDLFVVGSTFLPNFGNQITATAQRWADFIAQARESGQLAIWIQNAINVLGQMWTVVKNVASILHSMFGIAQQSGEPFLDILVRVTDRAAAFLKTPEGQGQWREFFTTIRELVGGFVERLQTAWPAISAAGGAFAEIVKAAQPLLNVFTSIVVFALEPFFKLLEGFAPILGPILAIILSLSVGIRVFTTAMAIARAATVAYTIATGISTGATVTSTAAMQGHRFAVIAGTAAAYAARVATLAWAGAQWLINAAMTANPIGIVIAVIAALIAGIILAWKHSETFRNVVISVWNGIKTAVSAVWNEVIRPVLDALGTAIGFIIEHWRSFAGVLSIVFGPIGLITGAFTLFRDNFVSIFIAIKDFFVSIWGIIREFLTAQLMIVTTLWNSSWSGIRDFFWNIVYGIRDIAVAAWTALYNYYLGAINNFRIWWDTIWRDISSIFWNIIYGIRDTSVNAWTSIWNYLSGRIIAFRDWWGGIWGSIRDGFWNAFSGIINISQDIWNHVKRVFTDGLNSIIGGVNWPIDKINGLFNIRIPTIPRVALAEGGDVAGRVRGIGGRTADRVPTALSYEEHVWSDKEVRRAGGHAGVRHLRQLAREGFFEGLAEGGFVTQRVIPEFDTGAFVVREPIAQRASGFLKALNAGQAEAVQATGGRRARMPGFAAGGTLAQAVSFARAQHGKPYIWGSVGPGGYDCSGFQSAITNVLRGQHPHQRIGTTATMPWPGFRPGLNSAYAVGVFKGNPGHTAGTLAGTNAEAGGSPSRTKFGAGAVGADHRQFTSKYYLPEVGGVFASGGGGGDGSSIFDSVAGFVKDQAKDVIRTVVPDVPMMFEPMALNLFDRSWEGLRRKAIELISFGIFDNGGWLPKGLTLALNRTQQAEAVVPHNTLERIERFITATQQSIENLTTTNQQTSVTFQEGAFKLTISGNMDAVTIEELKEALRNWGSEIVREFESRR